MLCDRHMGSWQGAKKPVSRLRRGSLQACGCRALPYRKLRETLRRWSHWLQGPLFLKVRCDLFPATALALHKRSDKFCKRAQKLDGQTLVFDRFLRNQFTLCERLLEIRLDVSYAVRFIHIGGALKIVI